MDKAKIDAAMAEKLAENDLTAEDLTEDELKQLREEVECELNGGAILDGVLFNPEIFSRKMRKEWERRQREKTRIMKTLSVQEPWAYLICAGIKDVENRTWKPAKVPGRILIHASKKKVTKNFNGDIPEWQASLIINHQIFGDIPEYEDMPLGAIIGYATVTGFSEMTDSPWDGGDCIKWMIEDAWLFDEPILNVNGKLNLFDYDIGELPPAHKVVLHKVEVENGDVTIHISDIDLKMAEEDGFLELFFTEEQVGAILTEDANELVKMNTITLISPSRTERYNLISENTYLFALEQQDNPDKRYVIVYPDGSEGPWVKVNFEFGNKI